MTAIVEHADATPEQKKAFKKLTPDAVQARSLAGDAITQKLTRAPGNNADLVILQAADPIEAIRVRATRLAILRRGKVIAATPAQTARLSLPGRPETADFLKERS